MSPKLVYGTIAQDIDREDSEIQLREQAAIVNEGRETDNARKTTAKPDRAWWSHDGDAVLPDINDIKIATVSWLGHNLLYQVFVSARPVAMDVIEALAARFNVVLFESAEDRCKRKSLAIGYEISKHGQGCVRPFGIGNRTTPIVWLFRGEAR